MPRSICEDMFIVIVDFNTAWGPLLSVLADGAAIAGNAAVFAVADITTKPRFHLRRR